MENDVIEAVLGIAFCFGPFLLIGGVIWLIVRSTSGNSTSRRILELEGEVANLTSQNYELWRHVRHLEGGVTRLYDDKEKNEQIARAASQASSIGGGDPIARAEFVHEAAGERESIPEGELIAQPEPETIPDETPSAAYVPPITAAATETRPAAAALASIAAGATEGAPAPEPVGAASVGASVGAVASDGGWGPGAGWAGDAPASATANTSSAMASPSAPVASAAIASGQVGPTSTGGGGGGDDAFDSPTFEAEPPPARIDWEQWIGVRGAAALGAIILVIAGGFFFQYSIEHGWITPLMRVIFGTLLGVGLVSVSELRLQKTHKVLADWLAGAGIAILYASFWAGAALYRLYPTEIGGALMVVVTLACATLAVRRDAAPIAVLGLMGGFITPLALSTGSDRPYALFAYLLGLDLAMLFVAYKRRWPWLGLLCLIATAAYQVSWLLGRLDQPRLLLGFGILAVFAILFTALPNMKREDAADADPEADDEDPLWKLTRAAGVLVPLMFTIPLALRTDLGDTFWVTGLQLILLAAASIWVGHRHRSGMLPFGAALIATATILAWTVGVVPDSAIEVWRVVGLSLAVGLVFHIGAEIEVRAQSASFLGYGASYSGFAFLGIGMLAAPFIGAASVWPWLLFFGLFFASIVRISLVTNRGIMQPAAAGVAALGFSFLFVGQAGSHDMPAVPFHLGVLLGAALLAQLTSLIPRSIEGQKWGNHASATFAVIVTGLVVFVMHDEALSTWVIYGATLFGAVLALFAAARIGASFWVGVTLLVTAGAHNLWLLRRMHGPFALADLAMLTAPILLFTFGPMLASKRLRDDPWTWRIASCAAPLYLLAMRHVYLDVFGVGTIAVVPIFLAILMISAAGLARVHGPESAETQRTGMIWLAVAASGFVTVAIPMQLDNEWITIGWALEALALTALWYRFDHAGLKYLAMAIAAVVCVRLIANPYVLGYYERSGMRVFNWITYTYLIPAGGLIGMWALLRNLEVPRRRIWETDVYPEKHAVLANIAATAAMFVVFAWINLTIFDWFGASRELTIDIDRLPARDLSFSIAWVVYAIGLLALGMWRKSSALRITSLTLILMTCLKVFLYDVSFLSDLYRVASLAGLAVSLIVVSLAYQRFVFGGKDKAT